MRNLFFFTSALLAAMAFSPSPASAQQTRILTADKHNEYGLVYSLPVTALQITVTADRTIQKAGPFSQYARKYLGSDNGVITRDGERWTIRNVIVRPYGIMDTETKYLMQLKSGTLTYIAVSEDGMLLSINHQPKLPAPPVIQRPAAAQTPRTGKEYLKFVNEDFTASLSSAKQAQMIAESLMEVRDSYISLTRGTADNMPTDGRQLELMLNSLHAQEEALTEAFTGSETTQTVVRDFTFVPEGDETLTLFRFSDFKGFTEADDYAGAPVNVSVRITAEGALPVDSDGREKQLPKDAVRYCIPGAADFSISFEGEKLFSHNFEFSQFGVEFGLNPSLFTDKKEPSYAVFSPETGALLEIGIAQPTE